MRRTHTRGRRMRRKMRKSTWRRRRLFRPNQQKGKLGRAQGGGLKKQGGEAGDS